MDKDLSSPTPILGSGSGEGGAFDPFDVFDGVEEEKSAKAKGGESNPWSDSTWGGTSELLMSMSNNNNNNSNKATSSNSSIAGETSFETTHSPLFQFSAAVSPEFGYNPFTNSTTKSPSSSSSSPTNNVGQDLFPSDPMATLSGEELAIEAGETTVRISIREQFSTVYDDAGSTPSCYLEGSIYAKPCMLPLGGAEQQEANNHFFVVVKDEQKSLANLEEVHTLSSNVSTTTDIEAGATVFKVSLPENSLQEVPVASYTCNPQLRPIPMLVKSRVQVTDDVSRVGLKIRANPSNPEALNNMVILIAVPPFVQGETVRMSRKGGVWDEMKRTICWTVEKLDPGEVLEIQAQFQSGKLQNLAQVDLQFPVLVRADVPLLFSGIDVSTDYHSASNYNDGDDKVEDEGDVPNMVNIKSSVTKCTRILHRKV